MTRLIRASLVRIAKFICLFVTFLLLPPQALAQEDGILTVDLNDLQYAECSFDRVDSRTKRAVISEIIAGDLSLNLADPVVESQVEVYFAQPCTGTWISPYVYSVPPSNPPLGAALGRKVLGKFRGKSKETGVSEDSAEPARPDVLLVGSFDGLRKPGQEQYELGFIRFQSSGNRSAKQAFTTFLLKAKFSLGRGEREANRNCGHVGAPQWLRSCDHQGKRWQEMLTTEGVLGVPTVSLHRPGALYPAVVLLSTDPAVYVRLEYATSEQPDVGYPDRIMNKKAPRAIVLVAQSADLLAKHLTPEFREDLIPQRSNPEANSSDVFWETTLAIGKAIALDYLAESLFEETIIARPEGSVVLSRGFTKLLGCAVEGTAGSLSEDPVKGAVLAEAVGSMVQNRKFSLTAVAEQASVNLLTAHLRETGGADAAALLESAAFLSCMMK